jgi:hypothetical protein
MQTWRRSRITDARINVSTSGLVVGIIMGGWHLCWSVLVATEWAQRAADFIFGMHFIKRVLGHGIPLHKA